MLCHLYSDLCHNFLWRYVLIVLKRIEIKQKNVVALVISIYIVQSHFKDMADVNWSSLTFDLVNFVLKKTTVCNSFLHTSYGRMGERVSYFKDEKCIFNS